MEGSSIDETGTAVTNELKNADPIEILHDRADTNITQNEESVENVSASSTTPVEKKDEEDEWVDILGSGQLKKKVRVDMTCSKLGYTSGFTNCIKFNIKHW